MSEEKAALARRAGATLTATSGEEALELAGPGFDVLIETAGVPPTIALAPNLLARHGHAAFIGIPNHPIELDKKTFSNFLRHEITLHGSWNSFSAGSVAAPASLPDPPPTNPPGSLSTFERPAGSPGQASP